METTAGRTGHLGYATGDYSPLKHLHRHVPTSCQGGDLQVSVKDTGVRAPTLWPSYDQTVPCFPITAFTIKVKKA